MPPRHASTAQGFHQAIRGGASRVRPLEESVVADVDVAAFTSGRAPLGLLGAAALRRPLPHSAPTTHPSPSL
jgi:hypothetical protein